MDTSSRSRLDIEESGVVLTSFPGSRHALRGAVAARIGNAFGLDSGKARARMTRYLLRG